MLLGIEHYQSNLHTHFWGFLVDEIADFSQMLLSIEYYQSNLPTHFLGFLVDEIADFSHVIKHRTLSIEFTYTFWEFLGR